MIGRVINPLGTPVDGKGDIKAEKNYPVEKIAPRSYYQKICDSAGAERVSKRLTR